MQQKILWILGLSVLAAALRHSGPVWMRKLGALVIVILSCLIGYYIVGHWWGAVAAALLWGLVPWFELWFRTRRLSFPLHVRLEGRRPQNIEFFPGAVDTAHKLAELGFEQTDECSFSWAGMDQFMVNFWHPEECAVASVCLCEQEDVAFSFVRISSWSKCGKKLETTNFPYVPMLMVPRHIRTQHLPCRQKDIEGVIRDHRKFTGREGLSCKELLMPDPSAVEKEMEKELQALISFNLDRGLIRNCGDGRFCYTSRGLLFLWGQFIKDMIRLC